MRAHSRFPGQLVTAAALLSIGLNAAWAQSAPTAAAAPSTSIGGSFFQMLFGLTLVLALLFGGLWLLKRITQPAGGVSSLVKVVGGTAIGTRERIVVVEVGQTWLILGVTPSSINTLAEMPRQALPPGQTPQSSPDFAGWLRNAFDKRNAR